MFSIKGFLVFIIFLVLLNTYFLINIWVYVGDTRDITMLDGNDKVKTEYSNLIKDGFIKQDRIPSSLNACTYADIEFGLGVLADYNIKDNIEECASIREYAGEKSSYWHDILRWFLK